MTFAAGYRAKDTIPTPAQLIDSMVLSDQLEWSFRLVSNFKQQQFRLRNGDSRLLCRPNNPFGFGFGVANQNIVIDILFNIKAGEENPTDKFAAEGGLVIKKKNLVGFTIENVHGYQITSDQTDYDSFREDISMFSLGLEYLRILGKNNVSVRGMKSGFRGDVRTFLSYGIGGFLLIKNLDADESIIPEEDQSYFNEQAAIVDMNSFGGGVLGGLFAYFNLPGDFFATALVAPGIGLDYKYVKAELGSYVPSTPIMYKTDLFGSVGYNRKKFYIHFTFGTDLYWTNLDYGNSVSLSITKSKLILGYNLGRLRKSK